MLVAEAEHLEACPLDAEFASRCSMHEHFDCGLAFPLKAENEARLAGQLVTERMMTLVIA